MVCAMCLCGCKNVINFFTVNEETKETEEFGTSEAPETTTTEEITTEDVTTEASTQGNTSDSSGACTVVTEQFNELIKDTVIEFNSPDLEIPEDYDRFLIFSCEYKIIYQTGFGKIKIKFFII